MPKLTIAKDTTRSDSLLLTEDLGGLSAPDGWTNAPLCFRVSTDGVEYTDLKDEDGNVVEVAMEPPGTFLNAPSSKRLTPFPAGSYLMLVSGRPDDPVPQAMDRVFEVYFAAQNQTAKKGALRDEKEHPKESPKEDHSSSKRK